MDTSFLNTENFIGIDAHPTQHIARPIDSNSMLQQATRIKVAVLIPAHNEEESIKEAVRSVLTQSICGLPDVTVDVLVIADNCTDKTTAIVRTIQAQHPNLYLTETVGNKHRKAGALNCGFRWMSARRDTYTYTFTMDADTVLDPHIIENGLKGIKEQDGGICCRVGLLPPEWEPFEAKTFIGQVATWAWIWWMLQMVGEKFLWLWDGFWKRIWWSFQNIEYSIAQSETVERSGWAHCLCGPGTLFRTSVLQELQEKNNGEIWRGNSLVEDYMLTKEIQQAGYQTRVGHNMFAYTDTPVGFKAHWRQRTRWYGGDISTWFIIGLNRYTLFESPDMGFQLLWFSCRIALILTFIHILLTGFIYIDQVSAWLLWLPVLTTLLNLVRFRYVPYKSLLQLVLLLFLIYEVYALWYGVVLIGSFYKAYTRRVSW